MRMQGNEKLVVDAMCMSTIVLYITRQSLQYEYEGVQNTGMNMNVCACENA